MHEADMKIPIHNSIFNNQSQFLRSKKIDLDILNNLELKK